MTKQIIQRCEYCNEETRHDVFKKEATTPRGAYIRRKVKRCRRCGTRTIENRSMKKVRIIKGFNLDNSQNIYFK